MGKCCDLDDMLHRESKHVLLAQVVFSSIPSVEGKNTKRDRKTHMINRWHRDWCHRWNFGGIMGRFT